MGLEGSDQPTLHAVVEFGYHSTIGNMDEAFRAIKLIKRWDIGCYGTPHYIKLLISVYGL